MYQIQVNQALKVLSMGF
uniref:Uncharacterized protein n=1 Tax=Moniliophthora roreri TaxID=221103 RepID=A0A0W0F775_MONRR